MEPCSYHNTLVNDVGEIKGGIDAIKVSLVQLDKRINGSFKQMGDHINESPEYRGKIMALETEIRNIRTEKLNSVKASQWRIGLIVSLGTTLLMVIMKVFFKV